MDKAGAWYAYQGNKIGQGKKNAAEFLEENIDIADGLEKSIRDLYLAEPEPRKAINAEEAPIDE